MKIMPIRQSPLRVALPDDFLAIAKLVNDLCQDPQPQCLQTWSGETEVSLVAEMNKLTATSEMIYCGLFDELVEIGARLVRSEVSQPAQRLPFRNDAFWIGHEAGAGGQLP